MSSSSLRQGTSLELKDIEGGAVGVRYSRLSDVNVETIESANSLSAILGYEVESLFYVDKDIESTEYKHFAPFAIRDSISSHPLVSIVMFDDFGGPEKRREKEEKWAAHEAICCYSPTASIVLRVVALLGFILYGIGLTGLLVMFILAISVYETSLARSRFFVVGGIVFPSLLAMGILDFYVVIIWRLLRLAYQPATLVVMVAGSIFGLFFYGVTIPVIFVVAIVVECLDTQAKIDADKEATIRGLRIPDGVIVVFRPFSSSGSEIVLDESELLLRVPLYLGNDGFQQQFEKRLALSVQPVFDLLREILQADMQDRSRCYLDFGKTLALFECLKTAEKFSTLKVRWAATPDVGVFLRSLNLEFEEMVLSGDIVLPSRRHCLAEEDVQLQLPPMGRLVHSLETVVAIGGEEEDDYGSAIVVEEAEVPIIRRSEEEEEKARLEGLFRHVERLSGSFETISKNFQAQTVRFEMLEKKIESEFQSMKDMLMHGL